MLARTHWSPKPETKLKQARRRISKERRRHLVEAVAAILKRGEPTRFAFEAACRHGLRSRLCLAGWSWLEADTTSKEIVDTALNRIGSYRPTWAEGQPEWVQNGAGALIERTRCVNCHHPLEGDQTKFCSHLCATAHHMRMNRLREAQEDRAYDIASGF